jgi:hypothetical protein
LPGVQFQEATKEATSLSVVREEQQTGSALAIAPALSVESLAQGTKRRLAKFGDPSIQLVGSAFPLDSEYLRR